MYIEDDELRDIYKSVTPERLQKLEDALLHLEKQPEDRGKIEEFLREAHTLKGDSRMLGVEDVETITHQLEDCLAAVKRGETAITAEMCDRLYQGIDALRKLVHEAVTGESADINVFMVLAQLMGADSGDMPESSIQVTPVNGEDEDLLFPDLPAAISTPVTQEDLEVLFSESSSPTPPVSREPVAIQPEPQPQPTSRSQTQTVTSNQQTIDTIRVEAEKLDALMRQAGELGVTQLKISRQMAEINQILALWSEWLKDYSAHRLSFEQIQRYLPENQFRPLQSFLQDTQQHLELLGNLVNSLKNKAYEDSTSLDIVTDRIQSGIQTLRLLPLSNVFTLFPRMVRDLAKQQGKDINLTIEGDDTRADKRIIEEIKDPLLHIIRNAIDHGIETPQERQNSGKPKTANIILRGYQTQSSIGIEIIDDGRGLDHEGIKRTAMRRGLHTEAELAVMSTEQIQSLIFASGFSTRTTVTELSGRGVGLDVVRANIERLKGAIEVKSSPGKGCHFRIRLGTSLATTQVLILEVSQAIYALPVDFVETMLLISQEEIFALEGNQTITFENKPVSVVWLADLLELPVTAPALLNTLDTTVKSLSCIILKFGTERLGILVNELIDQQDIVLKPQSKLLKRVRNILGATILDNGEVCMVLNPQDLFQSVQIGSRTIAAERFEKIKIKSKLLLVEDSIIIRTQMKRLLEGAGYDVTIAVDGLEGFNKLRSGNFDAVVSDVEMPNMSGLSLTSKIRQYPEYRELPIILVTTLASETDRHRGAEAGANAYLTKGDFDQKILIDTLRRLI